MQAFSCRLCGVLLRRPRFGQHPSLNRRLPWLWQRPPRPRPQPTSCASALPPRPATTLELYSTIHSMGVIVSIGATDDPDQNATASVEYRTGGKPYHVGFPLSRVSSTRFVGSLFWLEPGALYDVRVTILDEGGALNCVTFEGKASTRAKITIPSPRNSQYVSPTGSGAACSVSEPCALTTGLNRAGPGDGCPAQWCLPSRGDQATASSHRSLVMGKSDQP